MTLNQVLPQMDLPPDMIHLGIGQPSSYLLPLKEMETAAAHSLSKGNSFFSGIQDICGSQTNSFRKAAQNQNVDFHPGSLFSHKKGLKNYIRLSFAFYDEDTG